MMCNYRGTDRRKCPALLQVRFSILSESDSPWLELGARTALRLNSLDQVLPNTRVPTRHLTGRATRKTTWFLRLEQAVGAMRSVSRPDEEASR